MLLAMRADPRERILDDLSKEELDELLTGLDASELLELADSLSGRLIERAFKRMDEQQQEWFLSARQYSDDLIGHWLSHEMLTLPQTAKVRDVHRLLRRQHPEYRDAVFLTNRVGQYAGTVRLSDIWREQDHIPLADLISEGLDPLQATDGVQEASSRIQSARLSALPVVDDQEKYRRQENEQEHHSRRDAGFLARRPGYLGGFLVHFLEKFNRIGLAH